MIVTGKLSDIYTFQYGKGNDNPDNGGIYPVYGSNGIIGGYDKYNNEDGPVIGHIGANAGSVVYAKGKHYVTYNGVMCRIKANADKMYGYYALLASNIKQIAFGSAQPFVSYGTLNRIAIYLPTIEKQKRISSILSAYDNLIEVNNKRIKMLEQMAENLYKEWFVRFRFPGHESVPFENGLPQGWEEKRLGDYLSFTRGVGYTSSEILGGDIVLLSMNNIRPYGGYIPDYSRLYSGKYKQDQIVDENDLIMSITDMTQDRRIIGYVGIASPSEKKRVICTHLMKITSYVYDNYFLYGLFTYSGLSRYISEYATGANVLGLTADILKRVKCRFPNKKLAAEYSKRVTPTFKQIHAIEKMNSNLVKQRDLLLPRLMSGKLEV